MKSADYVYTVTKIYRTLLDEGRVANAEENEALRRAFSRGGFTDAYFKGNPALPMTGIRSESDKEDSRTAEQRSFEPKRIKVSAKAEIRLGKPSIMTLTDGIRTVSVEGAVPAPAENAPLDFESTKARLAKMGNTYLSLSAEDIELSLDEGVNLAPSALNALRRDAAEKFESVSRTLPKFDYVPKRYAQMGLRNITTATFFSDKLYSSVKSSLDNLNEYIDIPFIPIFSEDASLSPAVGVYLPPIMFDKEFEEVKSALQKAKSKGVMYALVGNLGQIELVKEHKLTPIGDFRLNITNSHTAAVYREIGVDHLILSPELTLPKARDIGGSVITYGRIPLMITERCFMKDNFGCKNCSRCSLTDRKGEKFPIIKEFKHRNIILNSVPTYIGDKTSELRSNRITARHLLFTVEDAEAVRSALLAHRKGLPLSNGRVRRAGRR
jgi:putative protease